MLSAVTRILGTVKYPYERLDRWLLLHHPRVWTAGLHLMMPIALVSWLFTHVMVSDYVADLTATMTGRIDAAAQSWQLFALGLLGFVTLICFGWILLEYQRVNRGSFHGNQGGAASFLLHLAVLSSFFAPALFEGWWAQERLTSVFATDDLFLQTHHICGIWAAVVTVAAAMTIPLTIPFARLLKARLFFTVLTVFLVWFFAVANNLPITGPALQASALSGIVASAFGCFHRPSKWAHHIAGLGVLSTAGAVLYLHGDFDAGLASLLNSDATLLGVPLSSLLFVLMPLTTAGVLALYRVHALDYISRPV